ncbi:MAG: bh protein [Candidatus Caldatribacterium sp.]|uniref:bh protein n=1 Tax=Candidatus Caldatribacterium sp. TaxID=2282143 RepID=UPI0029925A52|nr:bh protein [Candidatus Caldatribacterium sp.]MCX7730502.1 bh protein [Candidatus Caldatribacterium sp.]MDW8080559.1 bh protein [Candidatus Calescibacterium sp.]
MTLEEEIVTSFLCLACQRETRHRILYQAGIVKSIVCEECGLGISLDRAKLVALYGEQLVERILTKPQRLTEEYRRDLVEFFSTIPFRIITKPYRMLKEFESLCGD